MAKRHGLRPHRAAKSCSFRGTSILKIGTSSYMSSPSPTFVPLVPPWLMLSAASPSLIRLRTRSTQWTLLHGASSELDCFVSVLHILLKWLQYRFRNLLVHVSVCTSVAIEYGGTLRYKTCISHDALRVSFSLMLLGKEKYMSSELSECYRAEPVMRK